MLVNFDGEGVHLKNLEENNVKNKNNRDLLLKESKTQ